MTSSIKVLPVLHENKETRGIVSTDQLNLSVVMPDQYKIWLKTDKTNLSSTGASFQAVNTNRFMDSSMRVDLKCKVTLTGQTITPQADNVTPPYLWSHVHSGVEAFAVNKLISQLSFNIQNKQWTEEQRGAELIDVIASQFDQDILKKEGIFPYTNCGIAQTDNLYGRGIVTREDLAFVGIQPWQVGVESALAQRVENMNTRQKAVQNQYITIDSVQYTTTEVGVTLTAKPIASYGGAYVPFNGTTLYYSGANTLTQVVEFTIHEYIISPSLSNPYTKNPYSKSYYIGSYPVNVTMNFDSTYFAGMFKKNLWRSQSNVTPTFVSELVDAQLCFYTFDTMKQIVNPYQRVLYYDMSAQTTQEITLKKADTALNRSRVVTSNLSSLPPYICGFVSINMGKNSSLVTAMPTRNANVQELASYVLNPMENVTIQYGSQTDCMLGVQLTWREIVDLTLEVLGNEQLRNVLLGAQRTLDIGGNINRSVGSLPVNYASTMFDGTVALFGGLTGVTPAQRVAYWYRTVLSNGLPFFLLPTAKLNWRPISQADIVTIPEWNYGSNHYKSLIIEMQWRLNNQFANDDEITTDPDIICTPHLYLMTKRVRSIPMDGQGPMADEEIEYDFFNNNNQLATILEAFYASNMSSDRAGDQLQYVGGAFLGDVMSGVKKALPIVKDVANLVHKHTSGREGVLGKIGDYSGLASHALSVLGQGKRRVGRPSRR